MLHILHAADLHLDAPFASLRYVRPSVSLTASSRP